MEHTNEEESVLPPIEEIPEGTGICTGSEVEDDVEPEDYGNFELPEDPDE